VTGGEIPTTAGIVGSYGRFWFSDEWRAIGFATRGTEPVVIVRLPSTI
jgi:hypothetical protein